MSGSVAVAPAHTIQRIRLSQQVARWERIARTYRERGQTTLARRAERTLAAARAAAEDEAVIALVAGGPEAQHNGESDSAGESDAATEADRSLYEWQTSAAWGA
jgi:hypothetical protein